MSSDDEHYHAMESPPDTTCGTPFVQRSNNMANWCSVTAFSVASTVTEVLNQTSFIDVHTHLFAPAFSRCALWGVDELLTYHYLEAELFRSSAVRPERYWSLSKSQQADLIWKTLFLENTPVSEATRGVIAVLDALGLHTHDRDLSSAREFFRAQKLDDYVSRVFDLAGVTSVVMTNDPLDPAESPVWDQGFKGDRRFYAALRLDGILNDWPANYRRVQALGYTVAADGAGNTLAEIRRFLLDSSRRMNPVYMAVSLPDSFAFPIDDYRTRVLKEVVLPLCLELNVPIALMIGPRRAVNPALRMAGDASGYADLRALENLCRNFPDNRFLVTVLSRENQHELCVYARKFRNLMPFGCWWFLNNPSIVEEITRERLEMLGTGFIPQHSDARILEQLIYKWRNTRRTLAPILTNAYNLLVADGRQVTREDVQRDVDRLFRTNFESWTHIGRRSNEVSPRASGAA